MTPNDNDSPIDEIHETRRGISDRFGGDVFAVAEDAACRQRAANRPIWKPKLAETSDAPKPPSSPSPDGAFIPETW